MIRGAVADADGLRAAIALEVVELELLQVALAVDRVCAFSLIADVDDAHMI